MREALRRKAVWITAFVALVGATALMVLPELISSDESRTAAVVGHPSDAFVEALVGEGNAAQLHVRLTTFADAERGRSAVDSGAADIAR